MRYKENFKKGIVRLIISTGISYKKLSELTTISQPTKKKMVYGKANSILGNVLIAEVQKEEGTELTDLDIRKTLKGQLQDFKIPRKIKFVEAFSLTRTGKLRRT